MPLEQVPRVQKELTRQARRRGVPVIVATQVLESMRFEPRPTRAEVSDAATAVLDSVDAIMLSGETAIGRYPVRAVQTLDAVIRDAEKTTPDAALRGAPQHLRDVEQGRALSEAAVTLATTGHATAIVAITREGHTARVLSALRPPVPVYAATTSGVVARRLMVNRGVVPFVTELGPEMDATGLLVEHNLLARGVLTPGNLVVFVNVSADLTRTDANFLAIRRLARR
jgi:pyruvate kinase